MFFTFLPSAQQECRENRFFKDPQITGGLRNETWKLKADWRKNVVFGVFVEGFRS